MRSWNLLIALILVIMSAACSSRNTGSVIEGTGTVEATKIDISAAVAGEIKSIFIEEGDKVQSGDTLILIDDTDYRLQRNLVKASLDAAIAGLKLMLAGSRVEDVQQAQENVKATQAALDKAEANYTRIRDLLGKGSATKSLFDEAQAGYDMAKANYQASQKVLEKLVKGARTQEIEIAQANRSQAEANLELTEKKISDCIVLSPANGTVTNKLVEEGERIAPNGMLVTITKTDSMWITIYVGEKYIGKVKIGQKAEVSIDSDPDRIFNGEVRYIAEEAEFTPKNIQTKDEREKLVFGVKIKIDNKEGALKSGIPADALIIE